jgi:hypothetical protein
MLAPLVCFLRGVTGFTFGGGVQTYFQQIEGAAAVFAAMRRQPDFIGDRTMEIAQQTRHAAEYTRSHDVMIVLGSATLAIVFLIALYLGSIFPGAAASDFATMTVFP